MWDKSKKVATNLLFFSSVWVKMGVRWFLNYLTLFFTLFALWFTQKNFVQSVVKIELKNIDFKMKNNNINVFSCDRIFISKDTSWISRTYENYVFHKKKPMLSFQISLINQKTIHKHLNNTIHYTRASYCFDQILFYSWYQLF